MLGKTTAYERKNLFQQVRFIVSGVNLQHYIQLLALGEEKLAQCGVIIDSFIIRVESTSLHFTDIMRRLDDSLGYMRMSPLFLQLCALLKPLLCHGAPNQRRVCVFDCKTGSDVNTWCTLPNEPTAVNQLVMILLV